MPGGGERPGFGFAVADDGGRDEVGLSNTAPYAWEST
jgi:hypothetical protein